MSKVITNVFFRNAMASIIVSLIVTSSALGQGINFLGGTFQAATETARRANKVLFVEVYLNGCPHCAALAPVLEEKKVGDYFNSKFVSIKIEANSEDSKMLQQQKGVTYVEFPMFFFLDPASGQIIHQASPGDLPTRAQAIEEVLKHGRDALDTNQRTSNYANRYAKGERDFIFLVNYAKYAKATKNTSKLHQLNNDIAKIVVKPSDLEGQTGFYIIQRLIDDFDNPIAVYFFNHLDKYKAKFPVKDVKEAGETIAYTTLYVNNKELSSSKVAEIRQALIKLGIAADLASSRTVLKELEAHFREKNTSKAIARLNDHKRVTKLVIQDYAYLVRYFNEKATDNSYVPSLIGWVNDGLKLVKPNERNRSEVAELYLEQSKAYLRVGKKVEAKKSAQEALKIAKSAKIDTKPFVDELAKIK